MTQLVHGNSELRLAMNGLGSNICLVPTMGALHDGHATLIHAGKEFVGKDGCVVVSDFVNPKQFGQNEDFEKYPRNIDQDLKRIKIDNPLRAHQIVITKTLPKNCFKSDSN